MLHGTYVGTAPYLKGKTALLRECSDPDRSWFAQFDQFGLSIGQVDLSQGWHWFVGSEFELDSPVEHSEREQHVGRPS